MLEVLLHFVFEVLFQIIGELLVGGVQHLRGRVPRLSRGVAGVFYFLGGLAAGGLSLFIIPHHLIESKDLRLAYLFGSPLLVGGVMEIVGWIRTGRGLDRVRMEYFGFAALLAFGFALVRYTFAA
ncbi:MAG TPA: hypothetical protein VF701_07090 [Thermoanaerobaculia bacterium]